MIIVSAAMFLSTVAYAQQPMPEFNFKLTSSDLDTISKGLQTQPFGEVAPLMKKMQDQFQAQQPKPEEKKAVDTPKDKDK